ncbi:MAG: YHYH protein [Aphanocapsa sp. GSE-SYN-MK-11-07L]|nr:YHYH protein [Aphanocapsa sp. GSE-SYN-MK-11-07L]
MRFHFVKIFLLVFGLLVVWSFAGEQMAELRRSQAAAVEAIRSTAVTVAPNSSPTEIAKASNQGVDLTRIPIGDGRISTAPQVGYVWSCRTRFRTSAGPYANSGAWVQADGTYNLRTKPTVKGSVTWPSQFEIALSDGVRSIIGNRLPKHPTGQFPIARNDPAYAFDTNPNSITSEDYQVDLPAMPEVADTAACVPMGRIGVLRTGGYIFNALDVWGKDAVAYEIQDSCQGHPERHGAYHYHNLTTCLEDKIEGSAQVTGHSALVGYAFDGFGIYGHRGEGGKVLTNADLDACHGHTHDITWDGKKVNLYHYHATWEYPYTIGCYRGTPVVRSNNPQGPPNRQGPPDFQGPPPPQMPPPGGGEGLFF